MILGLRSFNTLLRSHHEEMREAGVCKGVRTWAEVLLKGARSVFSSPRRCRRQASEDSAMSLLRRGLTDMYSEAGTAACSDVHCERDLRLQMSLNQSSLGEWCEGKPTRTIRQEAKSIQEKAARVRRIYMGAVETILNKESV